MSEQIYSQEEIDEAIAWGKSMDELDHLAFGGKPVSDEEFTRIAQSLLDGTYRLRTLELVRATRQKLLNRIVELDQIEKDLEEEIAQDSKVGEK